MLFILALALSQIISTAASTVTAPSSLKLEVPEKQIIVNTNYSVGLSIGDLESTYIGVEPSVTISISYPNGTTGSSSPLDLTIDSTPCFIVGSALNTQVYNASQLGSYKVFWNITYSSDGNIAQDTNSSCTTGSVTQQSWSLNYTFEAVANQSGIASSPTYIQTQLPSAPTAQVKTSSASVRTSLSLVTFLISSFVMFLQM